LYHVQDYINFSPWAPEVDDIRFNLELMAARSLNSELENAKSDWVGLRWAGEEWVISGSSRAL